MSLPYFVLSLIPFGLFIFLLLVKRATLLKTSLITLAVALILFAGAWQIKSQAIVYAFSKGVLVALDIFFIIFGAVFFLTILERVNIIRDITRRLELVSRDYRVRVILLAWFFEGFLEGTAGFGVPAAVVVPLLMGIGFSPIQSVILGLLGNSAPVMFGAVGAPTRIGLASVQLPDIRETAALFNLTGIIVPIFMVWVATRSQPESNQQFKEMLPLAIFSGIAYLVPSYIAAFFGEEFPSIIGSIAGLFILFIAFKIGLFLPKTPKTLHNAQNILPGTSPGKSVLWQTIFPYALLIFLLIAGKIILGSMFLPIPLAGQTSHNLALFNPGLAFIIAGIGTLILFSKSHAGLGKMAAKKGLILSLSPFIVIAAMSVFTQLMIVSGQNSTGTESVLGIISAVFENKLLPVIAPFIGAFGAFLTGSATISNMLFGNTVATAAGSLGLQATKIIAALAVGSVAGNMIALADILAAESVAGVKNQEVQVIKGVILPCAIYSGLAGLVALLFS